MKRTRPLSEHIASSKHLRQLRQHADELVQATDLLTQTIGEALGAHCAVARVTDGELIVVVDGAAWATRLRFMERAVSSAFANHWGKRHGPRLRVHVAPPRAQMRAPQSPKLSRKAGELLRNVGEEVEDERLRAALTSLANRADDTES
jgi:hypothetical protein